MISASVLALACWFAAAHAQNQTVEGAVPQELGSQGTDTVVGEFCRLYGEAFRADSNAVRLAVANNVRASSLTEDQKRWLIFTLVAPGEMSEAECDLIVGEPCAGLTRGPVQSAITTLFYADYLMVSTQGSRQYQRTLPLSPREKFIVQHAGNIDAIGSKKVVGDVRLTLHKGSNGPDARPERAAAPQSTLAETGERAEAANGNGEADDVMTDTVIRFCTLYRQCCSAKDLTAKKALSGEILSSGLGENEMGWLLYSLINPGITVKDALDLRGGGLSVQQPLKGITFDVGSAGVISRISLVAYKEQRKADKE
ncbi:MAG: hypothetical protein ACYTEQ_29225 [Planctomycetota bacterium]|jgi:hypothetical protein